MLWIWIALGAVGIELVDRLDLLFSRFLFSGKKAAPGWGVRHSRG